MGRVTAMVEYLLLPAVGVLLLVGRAVRFLLQGVTYGPRARRAMLLLALPALAAGAALACLSHLHALWGRLVLGGVVACGVYIGVATLVVWRWRGRKVAALAGDVVRMRQVLAQRYREVETLFWEMASHPERAAAPRGARHRPGPPDRFRPAAAWVEAEPAAAAARRDLAERWRGEFERCDREELALRARVLEAATQDAPPEERPSLEARLAVLWSVYGDLPATPLDPGETPRQRWDRARQEIARLQEEIAQTVQQRAALRRRRLPLD